MSVSLQPMNFQPKHYSFRVGSNLCLIQEYVYTLSVPVSENEKGEAMAAVSDLKKVFSQKLYTEDGFLCSETGKIPAGEMVSLPAVAALLDLQIQTVGKYLVLTRSDAAPDETWIEISLRNQDAEFGHLYRLFYYAPLDALIPVRLYVPQAVKSGEKIPMLVLLHGGGSTVDEPFRESGDLIAKKAEEYGVLLMAADGCVRNCSYGCKLMPEGIAAAMIAAFTDNEKTLEAKRLSEDSVVQRIRYYCEKYPVDTTRVYLAGNSMGGMGSFYLAQQHPELFTAIAPSSAAPQADAFDTEPLKDMPIYYTAGTEDDHGFCHLQRAAEMFMPTCKNMIFDAVEGGTHGHCWVDTLDKWFPFLLAHKKQ